MLKINMEVDERWVEQFQMTFEETIERLKGMKREEILKIGQAGKQWALDNYGPKAAAERLMNEIAILPAYKKQQVRIKIAGQ